MSDVYAYGMILYQIITGRDPYPGKADDQIRALARGGPLPIPDDAPDLIAGIYENCVRADAANRPRFYHIVDALFSSADPPFPGADGGVYRECKELVFPKTLQSLEAEEMFNQPANSPDTERRFQQLKQRADRGDVEAELQLAQCYHTGHGCRQSYLDAYKYYERAAQKGSPVGLFYVGHYLHFGRAGRRDIAQAFNFLRQAADLRNTRAIAELGSLYMDGTDIARNVAEGMRLLKQGADMDDPECEYLYARNRYQNLEVRTIPEACTYYRKAHLKGYEDASCDYAFMLLNGDAGVQNIPEALKIYKQAGTKRNKSALVNLGTIYHSGKYVPKDEKTSADYYRQASDLGHPVGMAYWATCLKQGIGVAKNVALARELFLRAADAQPKGDVRAMHNYARMCQLGEGGPVDLARAYRYYEMASKLGTVPSKMRYAELTLDGPVDLPGRDYRQARAWLEDCVRVGQTEAANMLRRRELSGV